MKDIFIWLTGKGWVMQAFVIILVCFLLSYIESRIYKRLFPRLQKTQNIWDEALLFALHRPINFLILLLGISFAAQIVGVHAKDRLVFNAINTLRGFGILLILIWFMIRLISYVEKCFLSKAKKDKKLDKTTIHALSQLLRASVIITGVLIGLQIFGIPISGVLAFGGIGGLAVGFAAKDLLANFFGGLMIYLDRPFSVGDWIRSPDKEIEGTVEHVGWRLTRIRTFDKRPLFVPNGMFSTISVENPSRMNNRRIKAVINLRYDDATKVAVILKDIEKMLRSHPEIDTNQTTMVNLVECASWSLDFMIYTFTKTTNWVKFQEVRQDIFIKVLEIVTTHKAECAFPTTTVHLAQGVSE